MKNKNIDEAQVWIDKASAVVKLDLNKKLSLYSKAARYLRNAIVNLDNEVRRLDNWGKGG